ncbi:MAG: hypothetical protein KBA81_04775 [Rhabdochlamydiaceae bacterium]|nr:hypothetical protein [Rhabdochlamydiaceae bacterium]
MEMLSGKNSQSFNPSEMKLQQWMQSISNQNAQLLREENKLTQKVEQLENKFGAL